jgi:hypothetical protein
MAHGDGSDWALVTAAAGIAVFLVGLFVGGNVLWAFAALVVFGALASGLYKRGRHADGSPPQALRARVPRHGTFGTEKGEAGSTAG